MILAGSTAMITGFELEVLSVSTLIICLANRGSSIVRSDPEISGQRRGR